MSAAALFAASTAVNAIGGLYGGFAQAKQMERESIDLDLAANEVLYRGKQNIKDIDKASQSLYGEQVTAAAFSGADVTEGSPLLSYADNFSQAASAKANLIRQMDLEAGALRESARGLRKQANKTRIAALIGAAGTSLEAAAKYRSATDPQVDKSEPKPTKTTKNPEFETYNPSRIGRQNTFIFSESLYSK